MITKEELYPLPDLGVEPHLIKNFFSESMFEDVKKQIKETGMGTGNGSYHTMMGRWAAGIVPNKDIEEYALNEIRKIFNNDTLVPAYHYTVMYQRKDGCIPNLWEHLDQNGSQISINIAIENTANWPLIVEGKEYYQNPNDAVIFCGQQHMHARPPYPTKDKTANTTQLFMHYSTPDHWIQTNKDGIHKFGQDGDIRFFNRNRYFPLPDPPVNQPIGLDQDYSSVLLYYNDVVGHAIDSEPETVDMTILAKEELAPGIVKYKIARESARILKGLVQNSMFKQWKQANILDDNNELNLNYDARNCFNYFITDKEFTCHPQDPLRRAAESLQTGLDAIIEDFRGRYNIVPLKSNDTVLLRYEEGNMFHNHIDDHPQFPRVVSLSVFLNDDFEGGELEFKEFNIKIKPVAGEIVVFSSGFPYMHKVNATTKGTRYAVVKWYEYNR
jgi:hypothetical protein